MRSVENCPKPRWHAWLGVKNLCIATMQQLQQVSQRKGCNVHEKSPLSQQTWKAVPINVRGTQISWYSELQCVVLLCKQKDGWVLLPMPALLNRACKVVCLGLVQSLSLVLFQVPVGLFLWFQWSRRPSQIRDTYLEMIVRNPKWVACMMPSGRQQMQDFILVEIHLHTTLWRSLLPEMWCCCCFHSSALHTP